MALFNKFNVLATNIPLKLQNYNGVSGDAFKLMLSDTAFTSTAATTGNITEIAAGSGYVAGGKALVNPFFSSASGTGTFGSDQVVFTSTGATFAQFRYIVLYDVTTSNLVGWWDNGSEVNLSSGATYTIQFNGSASSGIIYTIS